MKGRGLFTALVVAVYCGVGTAQECPIDCQSKLDALKNQVAALQRAFDQQVPYLENFKLTPTEQNPLRSPSAEQVLPNYGNVLLAHVTLDHKQSAVLLPSATSASSTSGCTPNRATLSTGCRNASASARVDVFLGPLRQEPSGKSVYGIRVTVEGCDAANGQIPVQITVLSKL